MKFTIFRNKKDNSGVSVQAIDANELIDKQKSDYSEGIVSKYRDVFLALPTPESWYGYKKMARVCPVSEYYRNKAGEHILRAYNGVSVLVVSGLSNNLEVRKAKSQASLMPQVLSAFVGADGHSVVILTVSTLPDGTLPRTEEQALRFCTQAYMTSVQCVQPSLEFKIDIQAPTLDTSFLMTYDPEPYVNAHVVPFIIEQPTEVALRESLRGSSSSRGLSGSNGSSSSHVLDSMQPSRDTYFTFTKIFDAAYSRVLRGMNWQTDDDDAQLIIQTAEECASAGLPQEEVVMRLSHYHPKRDINEIRSSVRNAYEQCDGVGDTFPMSKHQYVAHRLREFMSRRYDIRYNEVMQMTEFRERQSLQFMYRELNRRELNTIHHEALLEGIEPTFGEVDEYVHSTIIPQYNPIEDYLSHLPKWDGKDHIKMLTDMVKTDNPYWERLFRQWFLSMVAHWMNGDEKHANSTAPILIGAQGYRKSTFCRLLLPPELQTFYTDSIDFRTNIEAERSLSRFMLVNIDEFDQLSEKQFAFVKHLFQKPATNIRRMYSETIATQRRYASFIGTTNSDEVLRDPTGNRRYLCVYVTEPIHTKTAINHVQLYAQALYLINNNERYWINDEDEQLIRETNQRFEVQQPLEQLFLSAFKPAEETTEENGEWLRSTEIMSIIQKLPGYNRRRDNNLAVLGRILTKLKLQKHRHTSGTLYLVSKK